MIVIVIGDDENVGENDRCDYVDKDENYDGHGLIQLMVHRLDIDGRWQKRRMKNERWTDRWGELTNGVDWRTYQPEK